MSLPLPPIYFVNWVNERETRRVFDYDQATSVWTPTVYAINRAELSELPDQSGLIIGNGTVESDGSYAALWNEAGDMKFGWVTDKLFPSDYPRLEFYRQVDSVPRLVACIAKSGISTFLTVTENIIPTGLDRLYFNPFISLGVDGLICNTASEINLLTTPQGAYLIATSGEVLSINP